MALFTKGRSGNPGGRRKKLSSTDVKELAKSYTAEAVRTLAKIMRDKKAPHHAKTAAALGLLDRGHGKPSQQIEATVNVLDRLRDDDRRALELAIDGVLAAREGGATETTH